MINSNSLSGNAVPDSTPPKNSTTEGSNKMSSIPAQSTAIPETVSSSQSKVMPNKRHSSRLIILIVIMLIVLFFCCLVSLFFILWYAPDLINHPSINRDLYQVCLSAPNSSGCESCKAEGREYPLNICNQCEDLYVKIEKGTNLTSEETITFTSKCQEQHVNQSISPTNSNIDTSRLSKMKYLYFMQTAEPGTGEKGTIYQMDLKTKKEIKVVDEALLLAVSGNGDSLVFDNFSNDFTPNSETGYYLYNSEEQYMKLLLPYKNGYNVHSRNIRYSPDGTLLAISVGCETSRGDGESNYSCDDYVKADEIGLFIFNLEDISSQNPYIPEFIPYPFPGNFISGTSNILDFSGDILGWNKEKIFLGDTENQNYYEVNIDTKSGTEATFKVSGKNFILDPDLFSTDFSTLIFQDWVSEGTAQLISQKYDGSDRKLLMQEDFAVIQDSFFVPNSTEDYYYFRTSRSETSGVVNVKNSLHLVRNNQDIELVGEDVFEIYRTNENFLVLNQNKGENVNNLILVDLTKGESNLLKTSNSYFYQ